MRVFRGDIACESFRAMTVQSLHLQKDALQEAGCDKIFVDQISSRAYDREGLQKAMEFLRSGDTLVVWRLDRLGRSLKHLIEFCTQLQEKGIGFKSLTEAIDTTTPNGKLMFHLFGALAEFERNLISERTKAGLAAAKARGRLGGRPQVLNDKQQEVAIKLYQEGKHTIREICQVIGISKTTLYNYLKKANCSPKKSPDS